MLPPPAPKPSAIAEQLCGIWPVGQRRALLALYQEGPPLNEFADGPDEAARIIETWPQDWKGVFHTLNAVPVEFTGRLSNEAIERVTGIVFDVDSVRPTGTNATGAELHATVELGWQRFIPAMAGRGWPQPRVVCTGNGLQIVYRVDLPNDADTARLISAVLKAAASQFNSEGAQVDLSVSNAARFVRVPGTANRKGPHGEDRPHRMAIVWQDFAFDGGFVSLDMLRAYAGTHLDQPCTAAVVLGGDASSDWSALTPEKQAEVVADLTSALAVQDADDRALWVCNGQALRGLGEVGFRLWSEWSATSARFPGGDGLDQWSSFRGERTSFRAVFERAQERGWTNPRSVKAIDTAAVGFGNGTDAAPLGVGPVLHLRLPYGDVRDGTTTTEPLTGYGNANRLHKATRPHLRHVPELKLWLKWLDGHWHLTDTAEVRDLALRLLPPAIYREGLSALAQDFKHFAKHAQKSSEASHASYTVDMLGGMPDVRISPSKLDADAMACGFDQARQIIDLRTGTWRPAKPEDFVTRSLNVASVGEVAQAVRWCQFIDEVFCGDRELIDWVQKWCGYCLTGSVAEHIFVFLWGVGANGKSVFAETLRFIFGDYAVSVQPATLCDDRRSGAGASPDLAQLDRVRLAIAPEAEEGSRFAESVLKPLVSGDGMSVRVPYGLPFQMQPVLKLAVTGNHRPQIRGTDDGIWRRVRMIRFLASFKDRADPDLLAKLRAEAPHIAAWLVEGCIAWQRRGLKDTPRAIAEATAEYRSEQDTLGQWLEECAEQAAAAEERVADLYSSFSAWAIRSGIQRPWTAAVFGKKLAEYRVNGWHVGDRKGTGGVRMRIGIRLKFRSPFPPAP